MLLTLYAVLLIANLCQLLNGQSVINGMSNPYVQQKSCSRIQSDICQGLLYNFTSFPNSLGHMTQDEAHKDVSQYLPLLQVKCSSSLRLFLCSLFFPICTTNGHTLEPCKSLCMQNKRGCEPVMVHYKFSWPKVMDCDKFEDNNMCVPVNEPEADRSPQYTLPKKFKARDNSEYQVVINNVTIEPYGVPCQLYFFRNQKERDFSRWWIFLWSCVCFASTLFSVLTFLIDRKRFQYPERPIIFISACYVMISLTYIVGFAIGDAAACSGPFQPAHEEAYRLVTQGTKSQGCIFLFMTLYFFTMASAIWWVILTLTWCLAAEWHWAHEVIAQLSHYFHLVAWALPAGQTIALLIWGKVDGDPLSGVCFTGLSDVRPLLGFVILPLGLCLFFGTCFLVAGFASMLQIRSIVKLGGTKTDKLENLILRIGVISLFYIIPAGIIIAIYIYQAIMLPKWMYSWYYDITKMYGEEISKSRSTVRTEFENGEYLEYPSFLLFMIKYLMSLIVGVTSGVWIWNGKTLTSWQRFLSGGRGAVHNRNSRRADDDPVAFASGGNKDYLLPTGGGGGGDVPHSYLMANPHSISLTGAYMPGMRYAPNFPSGDMLLPPAASGPTDNFQLRSQFQSMPSPTGQSWMNAFDANKTNKAMNSML